MNADGSVFVGEGWLRIDEATVEFFPFVSHDGSLELVEISDGRLVNVHPKDLSADGTRFVGYARNQESKSNEAAFWDEAHGLRTLHDELIARGFEFPSDVTTISPADFISSDGRVVVGSGINLPHRFWRVELSD